METKAKPGSLYQLFLLIKAEEKTRIIDQLAKDPGCLSLKFRQVEAERDAETDDDEEERIKAFVRQLYKLLGEQKPSYRVALGSMVVMMLEIATLGMDMDDATARSMLAKLFIQGRQAHLLQ